MWPFQRPSRNSSGQPPLSLLTPLVHGLPRKGQYPRTSTTISATAAAFIVILRRRAQGRHITSSESSSSQAGGLATGYLYHGLEEGSIPWLQGPGGMRLWVDTESGCSATPHFLALKWAGQQFLCSLLGQQQQSHGPGGLQGRDLQQRA